MVMNVPVRLTPSLHVRIEQSIKSLHLQRNLRIMDKLGALKFVLYDNYREVINFNTQSSYWDNSKCPLITKIEVSFYRSVHHSGGSVPWPRYRN